MDDTKLFIKNEKELETLIRAVRIYSLDKRKEFDIEKCAMLIIKKPKTTNDRRNTIIKSRINPNVWRKENLQVIGNIGSGHHQTTRDERKGEREKYSRPNYIAEISSKG